MRHSIVLLWCAASIIFSGVATETLHAATPSRLHLLRALENTATQSDPLPILAVPAPIVASSTPAPAPIAPKKPRPPRPTMPNKPADLTREQGIIFDLLATYGQQLQDPVKFTTAANKLKEMIDGKMMGTDPRTVIAGRGELQQALLAAALNALTKKQLTDAKTSGKLTDDQLKAAITAGEFLHREINIMQWLKLDIEKNPALAEQYLNAQDCYDDYEEEPISPNESSILASTINAAKEMSGYSLAGGATAAFAAVGTLLATYKKWRDSKISAASPAARAAVETLAKADIPEGLAPKQKEALKEVITEIAKDVTTGTNPVLGAELGAEFAKVRADIDDTEAPRDEMAELSKEVATIIYENTTAFTTPGANTLNPQFLAVVGATNELTVRIARMNVLLAQSVATPPTTTDLAEPATQQFLLPLLYIPDTFFTGLKNKLDDKSLTSVERDNLVTQLTTFFALIKRNQYTFGIASSYNGKTLDAILKQCTDLTLGSSKDSALFTQLRTLLTDLKTTLIRMYEQAMLPAPAFLPPVDEAGAKVTYTAVVSRRPDAAQKTAAEIYSQILVSLLAMLTDNHQIIIENEKLFMLMLDGPTALNPADISPALRKKMPTPDQMATDSFFEQKASLAAAVKTKTGRTFGVTELSGLQQEILMPLYAFLDRVYIARTDPQPKLKQKLFDSTDTVLEMIQALSNFTMLLSRQSRPDVAAEIATSIQLRDALFKPLSALPTQFFTLAGTTIKNDVLRYSLSEHGYKMSDALLVLETPTDGSSPSDARTLDALNRIKTGFKSLSFLPQEKEIMDTLQVSIQAINDAVKDLALATKEKQGPLVRQYTSNMISLISICDDSNGRTIIGRNFFANALFFTADGIFLNDVPEQIESDGLKVTIDLLKSILDNPKEFNYEGRKNKASIEYSLKELIKDAEKNELSAAEKLPKDAQDLYGLLNAAFLNLRDIKTYTQGVMNIYAAIKEKASRKMVGDNPVIYNAFFATTGVFCLPEGVRLDAPSAKLSGLDEFAIQAGFLLFECIQKNPNELGCDDMAKGFINKLYQFFTQLKTNQVATDPAKAAATESSVAAATTAIGEQVAASPSGSIAAQNESFIKEHIADFTDPEKMVEFIDAIMKLINSKSKRAVFKDNPSLKALFFSEQGIFPNTKKFPQKYIAPKGVKALLELFDVIKDNPNEFGIKDDKTIQLNLVNMLKFLKTFKDRMDDPATNYEDTAAYEYITPDKDGKSRFMPKGLQILVGNIDDPNEVFGPQISDDSLIKNEWTLRQRDLYKYIRGEAYRALRSPYMAQFTAALNTIETMCKELDQDESLPLIKAGKLSGQNLDFRRILNKLPLEEVFHGAVIGLAYLPNDILDSQWKEARIKAISFYEYLAKNEKKFEIKAEQKGRIDNIITWLSDPKNKAPDRIQAAALDGDLAKQQMLQYGAISPNAGVLMGAQPIGMMPGMGMGGATFNGTGASLYDRKGNNAQALAASGRGAGGMGMGMMGGGMMPGMMSTMGMGTMGTMGMYNQSNGMMMGGMGMGMMGSGMMPGMMPTMGMGGVDIATQIKTAMLEKEVADMRMDAKIATATGGSRGFSSGRDSMRGSSIEYYSDDTRSVGSRNGESVGFISGASSFSEDLEDNSSEEGSSDDDGIIHPWERTPQTSFLSSFNDKAKKEAKIQYDRVMKENLELLHLATKAFKGSNNSEIELYAKSLLDHIFEKDWVKLTWQTIPSPDAFFKKIFSEQGLLIPTERFYGGMSPGDMSAGAYKALKKLYEYILDNDDTFRVSSAAETQLRIILAWLKSNKSEADESSPALVGDSSSDEVETTAKVRSLIAFFTKSSSQLLDPDLAGSFATQALQMISQGWFKKRWKNITSLGRSNTGLIKSKDSVHDAVFSEKGLLKNKDDFKPLNNTITASDLAKIQQLYLYIKTNPGLVGIGDEPQNQASINAILIWLDQIQPSETAQRTDPYTTPADPNSSQDTSSNGQPKETYRVTELEPQVIQQFSRGTTV